MRHDEIQPERIRTPADRKPIYPAMERDESAVFRQYLLVRTGPRKARGDSQAEEKCHTVVKEAGIGFLLETDRCTVRIKQRKSVSTPSQMRLEYVSHLEGALQHPRLCGCPEDHRRQVSGALSVVEPRGRRGLRRRRFTQYQRPTAEAMSAHVDPGIPRGDLTGHFDSRTRAMRALPVCRECRS